ncbi:hypothetical protein BO86DRAFT_398890 [Aspergillus japonicus CBS 114.51]|uniref:AT hook motif protein n=2 Tax=Aspergillus TaxID=5052 RepID=A0A2V5H564_ASPV1|nr:hypothetical protein BO86DRAFT_398890 [Aspergillus japonicus CBS 114.51]PYI19285.1 hypothetical protein BO99DRAFT_443258 [Aspergillus violaceofuscus CBS 115571]RAH82562.1 hypothetical protein BO86DRAFT_398890 [Aspergillus japonicus CBS 114.51]
MPMTWNDTADAKLLLAILKTANVKPDYDRIAQYLGPECTPIAAQRRIQRLRERACMEPTTADGQPALPSTPTRDGAGAVDPGSAQGTPASVPRKRGRPRKVKEEGDADAEAPVTPKKRGRAKTVKSEQMEEEDPHPKPEDGDDGSQPVYQSIEDAYLMEEV